VEHKLPELPYAKDALAPHISKETIEYHYGKHHATYVANLNKLIVGTEFADLALEEIIKKASGGIFNNAAQIWNHSFYWNCLSPQAAASRAALWPTPSARASADLPPSRRSSATQAVTLFGSGWAWLVKGPDGSLSIQQASNAGTPLKDGQKPILTCDVWEHAYYIDYRNARANYVEAFWRLVNWRFAGDNFK